MVSSRKKKENRIRRSVWGRMEEEGGESRCQLTWRQKPIAPSLVPSSINHPYQSINYHMQASTASLSTDAPASPATPARLGTWSRSRAADLDTRPAASRCLRPGEAAPAATPRRAAGPIHRLQSRPCLRCQRASRRAAEIVVYPVEVLRIYLLNKKLTRINQPSPPPTHPHESDRDMLCSVPAATMMLRISYLQSSQSTSS